MPSYLLIGIVSAVLYYAVDWYLAFRRNLKVAQKSGIHCVPVPFFLLQRFWLVTHRLYLGIFAKLPEQYTRWVDFCLPDFVFDYRHEIFARVGHDTFLTVSGGGLVLYTCEPAVITQITTRRNDFPKPTKIYRSLDIYGKNVVSTEGPMWRQHRKATSPPFTEKNNHIVWAETIDQASAMLASWVGPDGKGDKTVDRVMDDTMRLSLYVISRAGFGRKLAWPAAEAKATEDVDYVDPSKIKNEDEGKDAGHSMSYTYAIHCLLDNILLQFIFPRWLLTRLPFKIFRKADEAYSEWGNYMKEAVENKKQVLKSGDNAKDEMDILGQLVRGQVMGKDAKGSQTLTDSEILGNMFVLILAGHETAANSIHFSMVYLALHPKSQRSLQRDLDQIFQGRPPSEWDYDRDLPSLFGGMTGAILAEELRLVPPVIGIPKSTYGVGDQALTVEGKDCTVPGGTYISLSIVSAHRHPKYWPAGKPTLPGGKTAHPVSNLDNDLEEFRPERWLVTEDGDAENSANGHTKEKMQAEKIAGGDLGVNESADTSEKLFKPPKGAYLPFSDGYRACLGRRFAQVEVLAALAVIFQKYSVELAVDKYATDDEVLKMDVNARADVWQKAAEDARELMLNGLGVIISLQMRKGHVNLRLVPRGEEKFSEDVDNVWKKNHPELCVGSKGIPGWKPWRHGKVHGISAAT